MVQTAKIFRLWVIFFDIENIQIVQMMGFKPVVHALQNPQDKAQPRDCNPCSTLLALLEQVCRFKIPKKLKFH
jgi:hypothetical protein